MDRVQFLTLDGLLALHERLIERFGWAAGVRDLGLAEGALYRSQFGYYEDLVAMAAALFESLLMNRAFVDGNKRLAFFGTDVFLRMNAWKIDVETENAYRFLISGLAARSNDRDALDCWLRSVIVAI